MKLRTIIQGPKWAGLQKLLRDAAWMSDVAIRLEVERGIITETIRFEVIGTESGIEKFRSGISEAVERSMTDA